ncbi:MAG TPA: hypothetical protein VK335_21230 [Bryobacteraceae bacterium]|nr:hypothetical protein [Bryobacteraceae bacterium]
MMIRSLLAAVAFLLASVSARAAVADSSAAGFTVKITLNIQATPDDVYRRLVHNVGDWWNPAHTFSGDARALTIDSRAPGCFCERLPNLGTARHMEVVMAAPGEKLVMLGALGPLQPLAVTGAMSVDLSPDAGGTKLVATYAVGGYFPAGLNTWAAPVDSVLTEQLTRLKNYVEHGNLKPTAEQPK